MQQANQVARLAARSSDARLLRLGGIAGLAFAFNVALQNVVLLAGSPLPAASMEDVAAFYSGNTLRISLAVGLVAINIPCIFLFTSVAVSRVGATEAGAIWGRVATIAVGLLGAVFTAATVLQILLAARAGSLAATPGVLQAVWDMHTAAFAVVGASLGTLVGTLALAARHATLVPRWVSTLGVAGGALCIAGATGAVATAQGNLVLLGLTMAGFAAWIVFLAATSFALVRAEP